VDLSSIIGITIGILAVFGALALESGSISAVIQPGAAIIVIGGTLGAGMVNFSIPTLKNALIDLKNVFFENTPDFISTIDQICDFATIARQEGALVIQRLVYDLDNEYLRKTIELSLDTNNHQLLEEIFNSELELEEEKGLITSIFYETLGGYAPTFGIIGAVLGLIQVMRNLESPSELGHGISTAFVATLYGVGSANLFFLPIAGKLRYRLRETLLYKKLIMQGVLAIHKNENPVLIREKLMKSLYSLEKLPYNNFKNQAVEE